MEWSDWIALGSMLIALIALGFSLWGYFVYDKPIKSLKKEILARELVEKKHARLQLDYHDNKWNNYVEIENIGYVKACNIQLHSLIPQVKFRDTGGLTDTFVLPVLRPHETPIHIYVQSANILKIKIQVTWEDESPKDNIEIFDLQLH